MLASVLHAIPPLRKVINQRILIHLPPQYKQHVAALSKALMTSIEDEGVAPAPSSSSSMACSSATSLMSALRSHAVQVRTCTLEMTAKVMEQRSVSARRGRQLQASERATGKQRKDSPH